MLNHNEVIAVKKDSWDVTEDKHKHRQMRMKARLTSFLTPFALGLKWAYLKKKKNMTLYISEEKCVLSDQYSKYYLIPLKILMLKKMRAERGRMQVKMALNQVM